MSVASCLCAIVYALFWRKVTNIGYPPIIVWENQICSADFGYAISPCISKMGCFSNTALIWTKPTDGIYTNPANSALHDICTKATARFAARQCKCSHFGIVWTREFWSVDMYSMSWDPNVPPWQFPIQEQKGNLINPPAAHTIAEPSAPKPSAYPPAFLTESGHAFSHLWSPLFHGKGIPTWDECPPAPTAIIATVADALARPKTAQSQLQREAQQWCTVFSTVCCGKWREDKRTLFYNIKNVTPFGNT